jgi:hypothetical protein
MSNPINEAAELKPCPFCGCAMRIESNRDWHRLKGDHDEMCLFDADSEIGTMPATEEDRSTMVEYWNRRATLPPASGEAPVASTPAPADLLSIGARPTTSVARTPATSGSIADDDQFKELVENYAFQSRLVYAPEAWAALCTFTDAKIKGARDAGAARV